MWLLEHRRSTFKEGVRTIFLGTAMCLFLEGGLRVISVIGGPSPPDRTFTVLWYGFLVYVATVSWAYGAFQMTRRREFFCRLSADTLECHCPGKFFGESFVLRVHEIAKLERKRDAGGEGVRISWYIWDTSGKRYWLTGAYGNPAKKFVARLRELCPSLPQIDT